jgi:hypothetical protein
MRTTFHDPKTLEAVLEAFRAAKAKNRPPVECYRAGVLAWRTRHPDQAPDYASKQEVAVILEAEKDNMLRVE